MTLLSYLLYFAVLVGLAWLLAVWMTRVYSGNLPSALLQTEAALLRLSGAASDRGMGWGAYALAVLAFNAAGFVVDVLAWESGAPRGLRIYITTY